MKIHNIQILKTNQQYKINTHQFLNKLYKLLDIYYIILLLDLHKGQYRNFVHIIFVKLKQSMEMGIVLHIVFILIVYIQMLHFSKMFNKSKCLYLHNNRLGKLIHMCQQLNQQKVFTFLGIVKHIFQWFYPQINQDNLSYTMLLSYMRKIQQGML